MPVLISCNNTPLSGTRGSFSDQALKNFRSGLFYQSKNEDSSFYYFEKALAYCDSCDNDTLRPLILFRVASLHFKAFNYKQALEIFDSSMVEAKRNKNFAVVTNCLNELGNLERDLNNPETSRAYLEQALKTAEQYHLSLQIGVTLGNIANLQENPDSALKMNERAISILKNIKGAEMEYCSVLSNMANSISDQERAITLYYEAISVAGKNQFWEILIGAYNNLACTYLENNNLAEAEACLRDHAIPAALKTNNTDWLSTVYESYAELFEKKGDFHQAYAYQKKALKSRTEASQKQAAAQMRLLNALFRAKNREIEIQEKTDEIKVKHYQLNRSYVWLFVLLLAVVLLVVISLWWIQRKNLKLRNQEIDTAKRLSAIEEKEQERLSMQLHDTIRPLSSVLMKQIESMEFPDEEMKQSMIVKLSEASRQLRQISHRLNPLMREQMTFTELTRSLRDDFIGQSGLYVNLRLPQIEPVLPKDTVNQLYFILQELMMNAGKHVKAGNVNISISEELDNLYILYSDDGPGFNPAGVSLSGLGLMHIFERTKLLHGKAVLDSSPGKGTQWTISIPLRKTD